MSKNYYLTYEEQRIWEFISNKEIVDKELVSLIFPEMSGNKINKLLHNLYSKGYLKRAKRNIYYTKNLSDFHKLALRINEGYIGLFSALKVYGLIDYEDFTIFVMTRAKREEIDLGEHTIRYMPLKEKYGGHILRDGIRVSTLEKTFYDCFLKIRYSNLNVLTKAIYQSDDINWKTFTGLLKNENQSIQQKAGYVLDLLDKETDFNIPSYVLKTFQAGIRYPVRLGPKKETRFIGDWKIQTSLAKEQILSWWY